MLLWREVASAGVIIPQQIGALACLNKMIKTGQSLTADEVKIIQNAGDTILKKTGLLEKGVQKLTGLPDDFKSTLDTMIEGTPKFLRKLWNLHPFVQIDKGCNACFIPPQFNMPAEIANKIIIPEGKDLVLSQFHEIGHALNHNFGRASKLLQKMRMPVLAALPVIALVALFKHKKAEGEKPQGFFDKVTTFIKNHAGKLTFTAMIPIVAEEALASFRGEKLAKELLSPELLKKVKLNNRLALLTYAGFAVASAIGIALGVKVKDAIAQPQKAIK